MDDKVVCMAINNVNARLRMQKSSLSMDQPLGRKTMNENLLREQQFHDKIFQDHSRAQAAKFYSTTQSSRHFYESLLLADCRNKSVLEYGCGEGSYAYLLAENGATVTGIDISNIGIENAEREREINAC